MIDVWWDGGVGVLLLGLFIGMQHALEADHVAAVSAIAARETSVRRIVTHGTVWGLGHTVTLMVVAGGAVAFGLALDNALAGWLELLVGLMLVGLGLHLGIRLLRDRIHFHRHHHPGGTTHWHAHSHRGEDLPHDPRRHDHDHPRLTLRSLPLRSLPLRSLIVGMMHGMAGSAALLVLTAASVASVPVGLGYVLLFGVGSILGMAALSTVIAIPLAWSARALTWGNRVLQGGVGLATVMLGFFVVRASLHSLAGA